MSGETQKLRNVRKTSFLQKFRLFFIIVVSAFVLSSCTEGGVIPPKVMHDFARDYPAWQTLTTQNTDTRDLHDSSTDGPLIEGNTRYTCTVETKELDPASTTYSDILLAGIKSDVLLPGSLLQGNGIQNHDFNTVKLERAPLTLTIDLPIPDPSITVDNPTTANIKTAVNALIQRADARNNGVIDVVPGTLKYTKVQGHSYEQSINQVGISASYDDNFITSFNADFNYGKNRKASSQTVLVSVVQPMYTISFSEDTLTSPDDLLAASVTKEDIDRETAAGRVGPNNLPVYVKSVTYGKMMLYSLTSTSVDSFEELLAAVNGSHGNFTGSVEYTEAHRKIISESTEVLTSFGGSQKASNDAILDLDKYFVPTPAGQAVPLQYQIKDVNQNVAKIGDITTYKVQNCTEIAEAPKPKKIEVIVSSDDASYWIKINGTTRATRDRGTSLRLDISRFLADDSETVEIGLFNDFGFGWSINYQILVDGVTKVRGNKSGGDGICVGSGCEHYYRYTVNRTTGGIVFKESK